MYSHICLEYYDARHFCECLCRHTNHSGHNHSKRKGRRCRFYTYRRGSYAVKRRRHTDPSDIYCRKRGYRTPCPDVRIFYSGTCAWKICSGYILFSDGGPDFFLRMPGTYQGRETIRLLCLLVVPRKQRIPVRRSDRFSIYAGPMPY